MENNIKKLMKSKFDDEDDLNKAIYENAYNNALKELVKKCDEDEYIDFKTNRRIVLLAKELKK
jgi:hypothetical protein